MDCAHIAKSDTDFYLSRSVQETALILHRGGTATANTTQETPSDDAGSQHGPQQGTSAARSSLLRYLSLPCDVCNVTRLELQDSTQKDELTVAQFLCLKLPLKEHKMAEYAKPLTPLRPFFQNVTSLEVSGGGDATEEADTECSVQRAAMDMLKNFHSHLANGCMRAFVLGDKPPDVDFPDTLHLTDLEFNNAYNIFKLRNRAIMSRFTELEISGRDLHAVCLGYLNDRGLLLLDGTLANLRELHLTCLTIGSETFDMVGRNFPHLAKLHVTNCKTTDQRLMPLECHYNLEELVIQDVLLTDANFQHMVPSLANLQVLKILYCNVGNKTLSAIWRHLVNLVKLELNPTDGEQIGDEGIESLTLRPHMKELVFENIELTDVGLRKLVTCMPSLEKLRVSSANVGDETFVAAGDHASGLTYLDLRGTHVTDSGLRHLVGRLERLEELYVDSGSVTESGLCQVVPLLASSVKCVNIDICESTKRISLYGEAPSPQLNLTLVEEELVRLIVGRFRDVDHLSVISECLSADVLRAAAASQTKLTGLSLTGCNIGDEALHVIADGFPSLQRLNIYDSVASEAGISEVVARMGSLRDLVVENKAFLSEDAIVGMATALKRLQTWDIFASHERSSSQLTVSNYDDVTELKLNGLQVSDRALVELVRQYDAIEKLHVRDTTITDDGILSVATYLSKLKYLILTSDFVTDTAVECIGTRFPRLQELTLKSSSVTDAGLAFLDGQLEGLEVLEVYESNITDLGIRSIAPKLKSIKQLNVCDNPNVNEGIRNFLHELFPHLGLVQPEETDTNEEPVTMTDLTD